MQKLFLILFLLLISSNFVFAQPFDYTGKGSCEITQYDEDNTKTEPTKAGVMDEYFNTEGYKYSAFRTGSFWNQINQMKDDNAAINARTEYLKQTPPKQIVKDYGKSIFFKIMNNL